MKSAATVRNDYTACSGCSLCLLVCPVWRESRDLRLTPHGRAKALQHGARDAELAASVASCTLCAACEPVCPENIDLVGMILRLRTGLPRSAQLHDLQSRINEAGTRPAAPRPTSRSVLLPDAALDARPETLARVQALLACTSGVDPGADIAHALETGVAVSAQRTERFLTPLRKARNIVVADGLLLRHLKSWLPTSNVTSLGEALSRHTAVRRKLRATDMYVIEARAYHADYERLVRHYDHLRNEVGCAMNLDLLRIAIPATTRSLPQQLGLAMPDDAANARWILHGRKVTRIVVECAQDMAAFVSVAKCAVVQLADLADDGNPMKANSL